MHISKCMKLQQGACAQMPSFDEIDEIECSADSDLEFCFQGIPICKIHQIVLVTKSDNSTCPGSVVISSTKYSEKDVMFPAAS